MERKKYKLFQSLLRKGIGDRTQAEFAELIELDPATLNRMLKNEFLHQPRRSTLRRMAEHMEGVTFGELLIACGYTDDAVLIGAKDAETPHEYRIKNPINIRRSMNVRDLQENIGKMLSNGGKVCWSVDEFFGTVELFMTEHVEFLVGTPTKCAEQDVAESVCPVTAIWKFNEDSKENRTYMVAYYSETKNNRIVVTKVAFDGKSLVQYNVIPKEILESFEKYSIDPYVLPFVSEFLSLGAENRLLKAIFGESKESKNTIIIPAVMEGFGFYLDERFTPTNYVDFLRNHIDSLPDEIRTISERVISGAVKPLHAFDNANYSGEWSSSGIGLPVELVITEEYPEFAGKTGWYRVSDSKFEGSTLPSCVMINSENLNNEEYEKAESIMYAYAKELGLSKVETVYYQYTREVILGDDAIQIDYTKEPRN